jgi:hypothetical protein
MKAELRPECGEGTSMFNNKIPTTEPYADFYID